MQIGCGTSLPGILAAACGARVTLTDREEAPYILDNVKQSILLNNPVDYHVSKCRVTEIIHYEISHIIFLIYSLLEINHKQIL